MGYLRPQITRIIAHEIFSKDTWFILFLFNASRCLNITPLFVSSKLISPETGN